jgi:hypothetical protein
MPLSALRRVVRTGTFALTLAILGPSSPASAQDLMSSVSDRHMRAVLDEMELDYTDGKSDHTWKVKLGGFNTLLIMGNDNADAQLYVGFGDTKPSTSRINKWNQSKRFSRAYIDDDGNPVLESDLDFAGGVTDDTIKAWIKLYETSIKAYVKFLNE